jgi:hypothetical protein
MPPTLLDKNLVAGYKDLMASCFPPYFTSCGHANARTDICISGGFLPSDLDSLSFLILE